MGGGGRYFYIGWLPVFEYRKSTVLPASGFVKAVVWVSMKASRMLVFRSMQASGQWVNDGHQTCSHEIIKLGGLGV